MQNEIWAVLREKLPYETNPESTAKRAQIWKGFDVNGNGYISLAEADKGMRDVLNLPQLFNLKPVLIRAYQSAKNRLPSKNSYGDDYVSRAEFRFFLMYLRQYYEYWVAFDEIDKDDDRRISFEEFSMAIDTMKRWGITGDPKTLFKEADSDGQGMILFNEFVRWATRKGLDLDTDDDAL